MSALCAYPAETGQPRNRGFAIYVALAAVLVAVATASADTYAPSLRGTDSAVRE